MEFTYPEKSKVNLPGRTLEIDLVECSLKAIELLSVPDPIQRRADFAAFIKEHAGQELKSGEPQWLMDQLAVAYMDQKKSLYAALGLSLPTDSGPPA